MPAPTSGTAYSGKTGSVAIQNTDSGGVLRYLPVANFSPKTGRGISIPRLVNNVVTPSNIVRSKAMSRITLSTYLFLGLVDADLIARAVLSLSDTSAGGYDNITLRANNLGSAPENYNRCKFASLGFSASSFGDESATMSVEIISIDPESTATALAAPASGPLSAGSQIASFSDMEFTGASDVAAISWGFDTGLDIEGGSAVGTNAAKFPKVPKGLIRNDLTGTLTITQVANPTTVLCASAIPDTFTIDVGDASNGGFQQVLLVAPIGENKPVTVGTRYWQYTYQLYGAGTFPATISDLV